MTERESLIWAYRQLQAFGALTSSEEGQQVSQRLMQMADRMAQVWPAGVKGTSKPCRNISDCTTPELCLSVGTCKGRHVMPAAVRASAGVAIPRAPDPTDAVQRLLSDARSAMIRYGSACLQGNEEGIRSSTTDACEALDRLAALAYGVTAATTSPDELFKDWCRKHGLQPEKCDDTNIWIRYAFEGGIATHGVMVDRGGEQHE